MVAQMVKHLPAMQETWVQSLCWEDPLEEGMATHSSILASDILVFFKSLLLGRMGVASLTLETPSLPSDPKFPPLAISMVMK